jgi:hypothetical protein
MALGGTRTLPLADGQPGEGEQPVTDLLETVGYRFAFEPPFADEGASAHPKIPSQPRRFALTGAVRLECQAKGLRMELIE